MIEVFKTNVMNPDHAQLIISKIKAGFPSYKANFDLEDCDRILRVECFSGGINEKGIKSLLCLFGFDAQVLPDDDSPGVPQMEKIDVLHFNAVDPQDRINRLVKSLESR